MSNLLDEAVAALRDEGAADDAAHRFTRARVMASLHQRTVKRRTYLAFVLPVAATFIATSAWGVSSGRASVWIEEIRVAFGISKSEQAAPAPKPAAPKRAARAPQAKPVNEPSEVREAPPVPPPPEEPAKPVAAPASPPPLTSGVPDAGLDAELELYRTAHRAHFIDQNSRAALSAWDAYLAKSPRGKFALEARYNRALCLVRLERKAEARAALEPFARGAFGAYRKREASELLEALDR